MRLESVSRAYLLGLPTLPGIDPVESVLLQTFVWTIEDWRATFSVNVAVGAGDEESTPLGAAIDRMWTAITRRRIDLVVRLPGGAVIVEAKRHARMRAATQVLRYVELYRREHRHVREVCPLIVCASYVPGLERVLEANGGRVVVVENVPGSHRAAL